MTGEEAIGSGGSRTRLSGKQTKNETPAQAGVRFAGVLWTPGQARGFESSVRE